MMCSDPFRMTANESCNNYSINILVIIGLSDILRKKRLNSQPLKNGWTYKSNMTFADAIVGFGETLINIFTTLKTKQLIN